MRGFFPTTANAADSKALQALHAARRPLRWAQDCHNPSEQTTISWDVCFRPRADIRCVLTLPAPFPMSSEPFERLQFGTRPARLLAINSAARPDGRYHPHSDPVLSFSPSFASLATFSLHLMP